MMRLDIENNGRYTDTCLTVIINEYQSKAQSFQAVKQVDTEQKVNVNAEYI